MLGAPDGNRSPHIQSLTKIEDIHVAPQRPKPGLVNPKSGRTRIKNSHLPMGTTDRFTKNVLPIALDTVGALAPWDYPSDQQIVDMWNLIFGSPYDHPLVYGDIQGDVFVAVKGLVRICLGLIGLSFMPYLGQARNLHVAAQVCSRCRKSACYRV